MIAMATCCTDLGTGCKHMAPFHRRRAAALLSAPNLNRSKGDALRIQWVSKDKSSCGEPFKRTEIAQIITKENLIACNMSCAHGTRWPFVVFARRNATFGLRYRRRPFPLPIRVDAVRTLSALIDAKFMSILPRRRHKRLRSRARGSRRWRRESLDDLSSSPFAESSDRLLEARMCRKGTKLQGRSTGGAVTQL